MPPAKKSLGQCFLVEDSFARRIVSALGIESGDEILEIGPGRGVLTKHLLQTASSIAVVEIDRRLIPTLTATFGGSSSFRLIHQDFLDFDFASVYGGEQLKVVGNLPYHLAAEVIFKLCEHAQRARRDQNLVWISTAVLMIQREVADRVVALPGGKDRSRLSVFVQVEANVMNLFTVPASAFQPEPKVDGGVVRLDFLRIPDAYPDNYSIFERLVRYTFTHRRKMLKRTLAEMPGIHPHWQRSRLEFTRRPETLSVVEWVQLSNCISSARSKQP